MEGVEPDPPKSKRRRRLEGALIQLFVFFPLNFVARTVAALPIVLLEGQVEPGGALHTALTGIFGILTLVVPLLVNAGGIILLWRRDRERGIGALIGVAAGMAIGFVGVLALAALCIAVLSTPH